MSTQAGVSFGRRPYKTRSRKESRPVADLLAVLDRKDLDDETLGETLLEAVSLSHRFPFGYPEYEAVGDKAVASFPNNGVVQDVVMRQSAIAARFLPTLVANTSDQAFLDRVVRKDWADDLDRSWIGTAKDGTNLAQAQAAAFKRIATPELIADLCRNGDVLPRTLAFKAVQDRSIVAEALRSRQSIEVTAILAQRFIDDAEFGPVIVDSLIDRFVSLDKNLSEVQAMVKDRHTAYCLSDSMTFYRENMSNGSWALQLAINATNSPEVARRIVEGVSNLATTNAQHYATSVVKAAEARFPSTPQPEVARNAGRPMSLAL